MIYLKCFSFVLLLAIGLTSCDRASKNQTSAQKDSNKGQKVNPDNPTDLEKAWRELLSQYRRRNDIISGHVSYINSTGRKDLISWISEVQTANQEALAAITESSEIIKSPEKYGMLSQAERKLSATLAKYFSHFKSDQLEDLRVLLEGIDNRMRTEWHRALRFMIEKKDNCLKPKWPGEFMLSEEFCSAVKANLSRNGCTRQYQPLLLGDICP